MRKAFGIRIVPCKFRQDNRDYYIDKENNSISDALTSVKHVSKKVADALYAMRDNFYPCFTDVLYDMEMSPAFDATNITILIKMGYFREFGSNGKLLRLYQEFRSGENKFSKAHIAATQQKRLNTLREMEASMPEEELSLVDTMKFEVEHYGTPITEYPKQKGYFSVLEVDDKYSPKIKLYNIATGTVGVMKVRKPKYKNKPMKAGDTILLDEWSKKPAYQYVDGKQTIKVGVYDLWINEYQIIN